MGTERVGQDFETRRNRAIESVGFAFEGLKKSAPLAESLGRKMLQSQQRLGAEFGPRFLNLQQSLIEQNPALAQVQELLMSQLGGIGNEARVYRRSLRDSILREQASRGIEESPAAALAAAQKVAQGDIGFREQLTGARLNRVAQWLGTAIPNVSLGQFASPLQGLSPAQAGSMQLQGRQLDFQTQAMQSQLNMARDQAIGQGIAQLGGAAVGGMSGSVGFGAGFAGSLFGLDPNSFYR